MKFKRIHVIVMDSVGIGEAPDAAKFDDADSHTLGHISETVGLNVPNMQRYGLGNIAPLKTVPPVEHPEGSYTKLEENCSDGDDYKGSEPTYVAPFLCNTYFRSGCRPSNRAGITRALRY